MSDGTEGDAAADAVTYVSLPDSEVLTALSGLSLSGSSSYEGSGDSIAGGEISAEIIIGDGSKDNVMAGTYTFKDGGFIHVKEGYELVLSVLELTLVASGQNVFQFEEGSALAVSVMGKEFTVQEFDDDTAVSFSGKYSATTVTEVASTSITIAFDDKTEFGSDGITFKTSGENKISVSAASVAGIPTKIEATYKFSGISVTFPTGETGSGGAAATETATLTGSGTASFELKVGTSADISLSADADLKIAVGDGLTLTAGLDAGVKVAVVIPEVNGTSTAGLDLSGFDPSMITFKSGSIAVTASMSGGLDLSDFAKDYTKLNVSVDGLEEKFSAEVLSSGKLSFSEEFSVGGISVDAADRDGMFWNAGVKGISLTLGAQAGFSDLMKMSTLTHVESEIPKENEMIPENVKNAEDTFDYIEKLVDSAWVIWDHEDAVNFAEAMDGFIADPISGFENLYSVSDRTYDVYKAAYTVLDKLVSLTSVSEITAEFGVDSVTFDTNADLTRISSAHVSLPKEATTNIAVSGISAGFSMKQASATDSEIKTDISADFRVKSISGSTDNLSGFRFDKIDAGIGGSVKGDMTTEIYTAGGEGGAECVKLKAFNIPEASADLDLYLKGYTSSSMMMISISGAKATADFGENRMSSTVSADSIKAGMSGADAAVRSLRVTSGGEFSADEISMKGPYYSGSKKYMGFVDSDISVKNLKGTAGSSSSLGSVDAKIELTGGRIFELSSDWKSRTVTVNGGNVSVRELGEYSALSPILLTQIQIVPKDAVLSFEGDSLLITEYVYVQAGGKITGSFASGMYFADADNGYMVESDFDNGYLGVTYTDGKPSFSIVPAAGYGGKTVESCSGFDYDAEKNTVTFTPQSKDISRLYATVSDPLTYKIFINGVEKDTFTYGNPTKEITLDSSETGIPLFVVDQYGSKVGMIIELGDSYQWMSVAPLHWTADTYLTVCYGTDVKDALTEDYESPSDVVRATINHSAEDKSVTVKTPSGVKWKIAADSSADYLFTLISQKTEYNGREAYLLDFSHAGMMDYTAYIPVSGSGNVLYHVNDGGVASVIPSKEIEIDGEKYLSFTTDNFSYFYVSSDPYSDDGSEGGNTLLIVGAVAVIAIIALAGVYVMRARKAAA